MKVTIESRTEKRGDVFECVVKIEIGDEPMYVVGTGGTALIAERDAEAGFAHAVSNATRVGEIWARSKRINWWAAEHSRETGS